MIAWPLSLTFLRLLLGPVALWCAWHGAPRLIFLPVLLLGLLSDFFDGVLARRLGVSGPWLRRFDSMTDVAFYLCILGALWSVAHPVIVAAAWPLGALLASEAACILVSLVRFGVPPATHCYSAKFYGLSLFFTCVAILSFGAGPAVLYALATIGLLANAEILAILFLSPQPPVDIPTVFRLRRSPITSPHSAS